MLTASSMPWASVFDNVYLPLRLNGMSKSGARPRIMEALASVGLSDFEKSYPRELSGGMKMRVSSARALVTKPRLLLMDEPFSALDPLIRARLQDELLGLQEKLKRTIIFVSHDLDEAFKLGNRIAIMEGGRIIQCGTPQEIIANPANEYVEDFVAHMNPLNVLRAGDVMTTALSENSDRQVDFETPVSEVIDSLSQGASVIGVTEAGEPVGAITNKEIISALQSKENGSA